MSSLAVLGAGKIGGEVAFLASTMGIVDELVLHDVYTPLLHAQVLDLQHGMPDMEISTDTARIRDADICIFAAGTARNPGVKTRADLLDVNIPVVDSCLKFLNGFGGVLVTVSNPMDVLNYYICKKLSLDRSRCIGFGGQLDSARFQIKLMEHGIDGEAYVLGEHGEHQVPIFSRLPKKVDTPVRESILASLQGASMEVIQGKGGTVFGPAAHIIDLVDILLEDTGALITASLVVEGEYGAEGCSIGVPALIGGDGVEAIEEWELDPWERSHLCNAGTALFHLCQRLDV
jgi:malate dehydrogenase